MLERVVVVVTGGCGAQWSSGQGSEPAPAGWVRPVQRAPADVRLLEISPRGAIVRL